MAEITPAQRSALRHQVTLVEISARQVLEAIDAGDDQRAGVWLRRMSDEVHVAVDLFLPGFGLVQMPTTAA